MKDLPILCMHVYVLVTHKNVDTFRLWWISSQPLEFRGWHEIFKLGVLRMCVR